MLETEGNEENKEDKQWILGWVILVSMKEPVCPGVSGLLRSLRFLLLIVFLRCSISRKPNTYSFRIGNQVECTMEKEVRRLKKINLALAVAEGESIAAWARQNGVPERTAFYWAKDPTVRREVDACRRRALNQAIGRLTGMAMNAVDGKQVFGDDASNLEETVASLVLSG